MYENPDDDTPRQVLADCLMALGEPRGRHMMLDLRPGSDEPVAGWGVTSWLFPLGPYGDPPNGSSFARGFPAVVSPRFPTHGPLEPPGRAWATVEEIVLDPFELPEVQELTGWLMHPNLRHLKALSRVPPWLVRELCTRPLPVKRVEVVSRGPDNGLWARTPEVFTWLGALANLVQVDVNPAFPEDVALCANSPLATRLERFKARAPKQWSLVVTPSGEFQVEAWLERSAHTHDLARALSGAVGFGTGALRLHVTPDAGPADRSTLRDAAAPYARVEWV